MGRCTWDPTGQEDRCKCHYCADRKSSSKPGNITSWMEFLLLVSVLKKFFSQADDAPKITSALFRAFQYAALVTLACLGLSTSYLILLEKKSILCTSPSVNRDELFIAQRYCLMGSTFTLGNFTLDGTSTIYPGVGSSIHESTPPHEEVRTIYYQWVTVLLFAQYILLNLPWQTVLIYKNDEVFRALLGDLDKITLPPPPQAMITAEEKTKEDDVTQKLEQKKRKDGKIMRQHTDEIDQIYQKQCKKQAKIFKLSMGNHIGFLRMFIAAEIFGAGLALGNLFLTNIFLGNEFFRYGAEVIRHLWKSDIDPMDSSSIMNQVFPKMAKCTWRTIGPSGDIQKSDLLCVLPLNVVYEKVYMVLWLVYIALVIVTTICLFYHFFLLIVPGKLDHTLLAYRKHFKVSKSEFTIDAKDVLRHCGRADKFMLLSLKYYARDFSRYVQSFAAQLPKRDNPGSMLQLQANAPLLNETEL